MSEKKPLIEIVKENLIVSIVGIPAAVIGGIIVAWIILDARFAPNDENNLQATTQETHLAAEGGTTEVDISSPTKNNTNFQDLISFSLPTDAENLNPVFGWQPGGSAASSFRLSSEQKTIRIVAGANTQQWENVDTAPIITYRHSGNFESQIKIEVNPISSFQFAGLGIRDINTNNTWLRIVRQSGDDRQYISVTGTKAGESFIYNGAPYSSNEVHFRIAREDAVFTLSYSANGNNWIDLQNEIVFEMSDDIEIYLITASTYEGEGLIALFSELRVTER